MGRAVVLISKEDDYFLRRNKKAEEAAEEEKPTVLITKRSDVGAKKAKKGEAPGSVKMKNQRTGSFCTERCQGWQHCNLVAPWRGSGLGGLLQSIHHICQLTTDTFGRGSPLFGC